MELALESYDVCIGLLQSKPKSPEGKHYTINLPNLRVDAAISVEEVKALPDKNLIFFGSVNASLCEVLICSKFCLIVKAVMLLHHLASELRLT